MLTAKIVNYRILHLLSLSFILFLFSINQLAAVEAEFIPNTVVVRFTKESVVGRQWLRSGRKGAIEPWKNILGEHDTRPYISDAVLTSVNKKLASKTSFGNLPRSGNALNLIAVITYSVNMTPAIVARKLSSLPDVEYAEALPVQHIVAIPNDPLFSEQYHLSLVSAPQAWDVVLPADGSAVVGIVDTGIDTAHIDLGANVWRNPGETGFDNFSRDKRTNNIDDDDNGFVDDWYGWDFSGADGNSPDNSPLPGNQHGTHVAGLVAAIIDNLEGVAGTAVNVRVMACKVGRDSPLSTSVENTADAFLYAAANGADIINGSFGSPSQTFADLDVINTINDLGVLIVAAAGNDNADQAFYPAAHKPVLSVASTDQNDERSFFSNVHATVDVTAPGSSILSTVPNNGYDIQNGTSMSSPIVAGIAAMVHMMDTTLTPEEVRSVIKANTDNIDSKNISWVGKLGSGRVNALNAVSFRTYRFAEVIDYSLHDVDGDSIFLPGDSLHLSLSVKNILSDLNNVKIKVTPAPSQFMPILNIDSALIGAMTKGETRLVPNEIALSLPRTIGQNAELSLLVTIYDDDQFVGRDLITATVNQTFRTIHANNIGVTSNSEGNVGYNDYPENTQGDGFWYGNNRTSLLFEGALIMGTGPFNISDAARGVPASLRNEDFTTSRIVELRSDSVVTGQRLICEYSDSSSESPLNVNIVQHIYERTEDSLKNAVFVVYDITNTSSAPIIDLRVAQFMDWDLGPAGSDNGSGWDNERGFGVVQHAFDPSLPSIGVSMISPMTLNFYAIDNEGNLYTPGIYDSFTDEEKWLMMSGGLSRTNSSITDVSMMIGGGPFSLVQNETRQVSFIIGAGSDLVDLGRTMKAARSAAKQMNIDVTDYTPLALSDNFLYIENGNAVYPGSVNVHFELRSRSDVVIDIVDLFGRPLGDRFVENSLPAGKHTRPIDIPSVATATYFVRFTTLSTVQLIPIQILP